MRAKNTIVINGKVYDAISGLPVGAPEPIARMSPASAVKAPAKTAASKPRPHIATPAKTISDIGTHRNLAKAGTVHRKTQRSQTLRRDILKQPQAVHHSNIRRKPELGHHTRSELITKFAAHPQPIAKPAEAHVVHTHDTSHAPKPTPAATIKPSALSSRELKEKLIADRLAAVPHTHPLKDHKPPKRNFLSRAPRVSSVLAASLAVVVLGGYLTYINMPNLSMRVAAARAGIDASFPEYHPDGYRFDGPIAYDNGEVSVKFASNTNQSGYTVNQKNSNWDSQAVLDNYVTKKSKNYLTYSEQGLTIYAYDSEAAWVNGGVLYTIEGNAPLSSDQILRIASSM